MEMINIRQKKKLGKIFRKSGKTFQTVAEEAGLKNVPNHLDEVTHEEARKMLKYFSSYLIEPKEKQ